MSKQLKKEKEKYLTLEGVEFFMPIMKKTETTAVEEFLL